MNRLAAGVLTTVITLAGCATLGGSDVSVVVSVLNERTSPVNVTVLLDGHEVYSVAIPASDSGGTLRTSDPVEMSAGNVRVEAIEGTSGEKGEANVDLRDQPYLLVQVGSTLRVTGYAEQPEVA